jgi:methylmalonyl-CoA mutase cobalamin-binding subunit
VKQRARDYDLLKEQVDAFEKRSGIRISEYAGGANLGRAVALVQKIGLDETYRTATGLQAMVADMADRLGSALEDFKKEG